MRTRPRKAFTLLELIVVIVILGILAALAIPTFSAVIQKARQSNVDNTAAALGREVAALAAFDNAAPNSNSSYGNTAIGDLPSGYTAVWDPSPNRIEVTNTADGVSACLTLGTQPGHPGSVASGTC